MLQLHTSMNIKSGFTLVEVIVSITLVVSFVSMLATTYGFISSGQEKLKRTAIASSIAKSNLNKFKFDLELECTSDSEVLTLLDDDSDNRQPTPENGFSDISQEVTAQFSRGCESLPVVISTVTYIHGDTADESSFATYAK